MKSLIGKNKEVIDMVSSLFNIFIRCNNCAHVHRLDRSLVDTDLQSHTDIHIVLPHLTGVPLTSLYSAYILRTSESAISNG